ncbi:MAG: aldo/keto reductase, partial [Lentisphaeria bacterium]|nr:aldo/keto reductase [Lentisphaeria bacterium]
MSKVSLGSTGFVLEKNGFGALPVQRVPEDTAISLLRRAYDGGIEFFDTARYYTDSEEKLGKAFAGMRDKIVIASKTMALDVKGFESDLSESLKNLRTDHIDIYQFHNPPFCPVPGDGTGLYEAMLKAKQAGKIRHISITSHRYFVAEEAVKSGLYATLQYPFSYICGEMEHKLVSLCKEHNTGFIAMKALAGGLIHNSRAASAYIGQFDNVLPIWGIQRAHELEEFLSYVKEPPQMDEELREIIENDRKMLAGDFCRACGYCLPCPAKIDIPQCARMSLMLRRAPSENFLTPEWQNKMEQIDDCINCGN